MEKNDSESTLNEDVIGIPENLEVESTSDEDEHQLEDRVVGSPWLERLVLRNLENLEVTLRTEICIYRVPTAIRRVNAAAYTPQVISIGPIHHGKHELREMEDQKWRYLKVFCERVEGKTQKEVVRKLLAIIAECEEEIRHCYAERSAFDGHNFVIMILLDAVFLIELFLGFHEDSKYESDFVIGQPSIRQAILSDLLLLENQLPYFVLKRLYDETPIAKSVDFVILASIGLTLFMPGAKSAQLGQVQDFVRSARSLGLGKSELDSFSAYVAQREYIPNAKLPQLKRIRHFVDLVRSSILDESMLLSLSPDYAQLKYSASKLYQAGVKFEAITYKEGNMLEVRFVNGVLKMSVFEMSESSELFLRNIMAFEQCHYPIKSYLCNFIYLLDHLINTSEDVDLLVGAGIIVNWLGSNKIFADVINKLCQELGDDESCYASIYKNLNKHYENRWNRRKATLRLVYFSNLWRGTATVAAAMLLLMTLMQTITSIRALF